MSHAIYLSPKCTTEKRTIRINHDMHNPQGWIETPTGRGFVLVKKQHNPKCEKGLLWTLKKLLKRSH